MPDESSNTPLNPDEELAQRLEQLHQRVIETAPPGSDDDPAVGASESELESMGRLFRLIERVRQHDDDTTPQVRAHDTTYPLPPAEGPAESPEPANVPPGHELGRFTIRRKLGEGGYGFVFLALDRDLDREVALKIPRPEAILTDDMRARFLREGKAAALLSHPSIVPVFETGHAAGVCHIVSRYVDGITLADWLARHGERLPPAAAARLVAALADAVQHAHSKGVIHRDLKPANVLLEGLAADASDAGENLNRAVRITDFGLAKTHHDPQGLTGSSSILGTPAYMSPEQAQGATADATADIYALGAMLYELLTGTPPHSGSSILQTLRHIQEREPVAPTRHNRQVPRDLEAICLKCLEKQPSRRYDSASQLQSDLENYLGGRPVRARPITQIEYAWRWCRRNPALATALTALAVSLAAGGALVGYQVRQTVRANRELLSKNQQLVESNQHLRRARDQEAATVDFLATSFARPDPQLDGRTVTLASLLDRNLAILQHHDAMPSNTRASLAFSLGRAYHGLGLYPEAIDALRFSDQQWSLEMDQSNPLRLDVQSQLGLAYVDAGRCAEAVELLTPAADRALEALGESDPKTTALRNHLALAYQGLGQSDRAIAVLTQLYAATGRDPDRLSESDLQTVSNLGYALAAARRFSDAIPLQETAVQNSRVRFGNDDPRTLKKINNLAASYASVGRAADAASLVAEGLTVRRAVLGEDHLQTLIAENNLAGALMTSGDVEQAVAVLSNLLPRARRIIGDDHPTTLGMTLNLGGGYLWLDRPAEAAETFASVWQQMRECLGDQHPTTLKAYELLGVAHLESGAATEAEDVFRNLIDIERGRTEPRQFSLAKLHWRLGGCLLKQECFAEAEPVLRESVRQFAEQAPQRWQSADAKSLLGATLVELGRTDEGRDLLRTGQQELQQHADHIPLPRRQAVLDTAQRRIRQLAP